MSRSPFVAVNFQPTGALGRVTQDDIIRQMAAEIQAGRLRPNMRLPPVRTLEERFGISKNTVQAAYDELAARGLVESRARLGMFVAAVPEGNVSVPMFQASSAQLRASGLPSVQAVPSDHVRLDMVFIDWKLLPREQIADCMRSVLANPGLRPLYDGQGHAGLRAKIAARLSHRGMDVDPDDVILTGGSQQALDMVARSLQHRVIATENPVYSHARYLFAGLGCQLVPLTLNPFQSIDLAEWEETLRETRPALVYVIPHFQNPTGYSYSTSELERLLELSEELGFAILEDDWGSDMLSGSEFRPTLRALGGSNVLYVNSFTKKLLPSLRLGYIVASKATREALVAAKRLATLGNPEFLEAVLFEFMDRGYYDSHLARMNAELDLRYSACLSVLRETMPPEVRFSLPGGGPTLWLELPSQVNLRQLSERLSAQRIAIQMTHGHFYGKPHLDGFRVGYAYNEPHVMREAVARVAAELRQLVLQGEG
jgi:DNA-binding transcriptional MocR family regulator